MSGGEILFLAHRIPFPPDRGDKIRSHHILKALAGLAPVHVGTFADDEVDSDPETELALVATSYHIAHRGKPLALAGLQAMATRKPVSIAAFANGPLREWVRETIRTRPIATIYVFSSQMAQFVPERFRGRVVMDFVDVDSAKFEAYAERAMLPARSLYAREARLLAAWEGQVGGRSAVSLFVSDEEAALFRSRLGAVKADVRTLGNGIDCNLYAPDRVSPEPFLATNPGPHIVFTGQMDYPPNVAAVVRFATRIMPAVRERLPEARFHIVGRRPTAAVAALNGQNGTIVAGQVDDTRTWLAGADLVVAPLEIARGIQNKVLEAMAMARPVVASPEAAMGIEALADEDLVIAQDDAAFVASVIQLLESPAERARIGRAARRMTVARQSWPTMLAELPEIVGFGPRPARHAA